MVRTTSVTKLRLKWTLRDAPRRIPERPWLGGGVASAHLKRRGHEGISLSLWYRPNYPADSQGRHFLRGRFLLGPREASRLWKNSWPSSREIFSLRVRQLTSSSGGSREFPSPPSVDNGRRFGVKECFCSRGTGHCLLIVVWCDGIL
jgi:hypothetical protein